MCRIAMREGDDSLWIFRAETEPKHSKYYSLLIEIQQFDINHVDDEAVA